jgi:hypothetical protein
MALFLGDASAPTRFGTDVADTTDETGLFLKMFGGEVFAAFSETTIMMDKHYIRELSTGKSAQFPKTWKVSGGYHSAGAEMLGQDTDETERVISIDGLLVSHVGIYDLDDAMSHFDVGGRYSEELGKFIGRTLDTNVMRTVIKTARDDSSLGGGSQTTSPFPAGQTILSAGITGTLAATAVGSVWQNAFRAMRIGAGEDNIPDQDPLWVAVPYDTFDSIQWGFINDTAANGFLYQNRDNVFAQGGAQGEVSGVIKHDGISVLRSNLLPQSNDTANSDVKAKYRADFSTTLGLGWHTDGVATVKLIGMGVEHTRDTRRQEDFLVAKIAVGHGSVRNEGTWEFRDT